MQSLLILIIRKKKNASNVQIDLETVGLKLKSPTML